MPLEHPKESRVGCILIIADATSSYNLLWTSVIAATSMSFLTNMPQHGKTSIFHPFVHSRIRTRHQRRLLLSTPVPHEGETPSIPDTPHFVPDQGDPSPEEPSVGVATRIAVKERMTQTPPLLSRLIQGYLDQAGIEECPYHQMDHGVRGTSRSRVRSLQEGSRSTLSS